MELTKDSLFIYGNIPITFKRLAIINPNLLRTYFVANNSYLLDSDCILIVKKIRNRQIRNRILSLDEYRKKLEKERKEREHYTSLSDIKSGDYNVFYKRRTNYLLYGI